MPKYFGLESVPINHNEGFGRKKRGDTCSFSSTHLLQVTPYRTSYFRLNLPGYNGMIILKGTD